MTCLWITILDIFVCLPSLELTKFEQHVCSKKVVYANLLSLGTYGDKQLQKKRKVATLNSAHQAKKQCNFENGWLLVYIACSESSEPKRFVRCWNKVERKHIQKQRLNQFHCYNQNMDFVNRMDQDVAKYWYPNRKMVAVPVCLNGICCSSRCVGIVLY